MNKTELISAAAKKADMNKKDMKVALKAILEVIEEELEAGEKVQVVGFGTFSTSVVAAHDGVNPKDRTQKVHIEESTRVHFSAGQGLKDKVNGRK